VLFNVDKPGKFNLVVGKKPEDAKAATNGESAAALKPPAPAPAPRAKERREGERGRQQGSQDQRRGPEARPQIGGVLFEALPRSGEDPTIGYGTIQYPNGKPVTMKDPPITEAQAEEYLRHEVKEKEDAVRKMVKVPLNENQFSSLVSFSYNVGTGALQDSTLLKKLNAGDYDGAAGEFGKWNKGTVKNPKTGKKERVELRGLTTRRAAERKLFETAPKGAPQPKALADQAEGASSNGANGASAAASPASPAAPAPPPSPVKVGTTQAKPAARAQMTKHTVPLKVEVSSPQGGEALTIDPGAHPGADPSMPSIKLKGTATLSGQPISEGMFRWQIFISGQYKTRMGMKDYNLLAGDAQTKPDQEVDSSSLPRPSWGAMQWSKCSSSTPSSARFR
jgi:lysozyme